MKKLLSLLGAIGMIATSAITTMAYSNKNDVSIAKTDVSTKSDINENILILESNPKIINFIISHNKIDIYANTIYLGEVIAEAQILIAANPGDPNLGPVEASLSAAQTVLNNINATQNEVNIAAGNLVQAMWDFVPAVNKTTLNTTISNAQSLITANSGDPNLGPVESSLTSAQTVFNNVDATQIEVNDANGNLVQAMWDFVPAVNKTYLSDVISKAEALVAANPGDPNLSMVEASLTAAQTVFNNTNATQSDVNTAAGNLVQAMWDFVPTVDKSSLGEIIDKAVVFIQVRQSDPNIAPVEASLTSAQTVFNNTNATQSDVNIAYDDLYQSMIDFVPST